MKKLILGCSLLFLLLGSCATTVRRGELAAEYYNLGNAYLEIGKHDKAIGFYEKAIRLDPENRRAQFNLALALIDSGKAPEALAVLEDLAEVDPDNQEVLGALAFTYYAAGSGEDAVAVYDVSGRAGRGVLRGLIPTGWYPSSLAVSPDGTTLAVGTLLGVGSGAGSTRGSPGKFGRYVHSVRGSVNVITVPTDAELAAYTTSVARNDRLTPAGRGVAASVASLNS